MGGGGAGLPTSSVASSSGLGVGGGGAGLPTSSVASSSGFGVGGGGAGSPVSSAAASSSGGTGGGGGTDNCFNGFFDPQDPPGETDVDCGGPVCPLRCGFGQSCEVESDCIAQAICDLTLFVCSSCFDGIQDYDETGVDCGGSLCPACNNTACFQHEDCVSCCCVADNKVVQGTASSSVASSGVPDAGGACGTPKPNPVGPAMCFANHCCNNVKDQGETDVDCGGPCAGCGQGKVCVSQMDCAFPLLCSAGHCM